MNVLEIINARANKFKPIWKEGSVKYSEDVLEKAYILCNEIRRETNVPEYDWRKFNEGYDYRNIFCEDWKVAKDEFVNLVFGWW